MIKIIQLKNNFKVHEPLVYRIVCENCGTIFTCESGDLRDKNKDTHPTVQCPNKDCKLMHPVLPSMSIKP